MARNRRVLSDKAQQHPLSVYYYLKLFGADAERIQNFFNEHHLGIDLATNKGVNGIVRLGGRTHSWHDHDQKIDFFCPQHYDMTNMREKQMQKQFYCDQLAKCLMGKSDRNMRLFVYPEGEQYPRELSYNAQTGTLELSDPIEKLPEPQEPSGWQKFWHFFGFYKKEFEDYEAAKQLTEEQTHFLRNPYHNSRNENNQASITEDLDMKEKAAQKYDRLISEISAKLDTIYGRTEETSRNDFSRFDYVMIEGRTLRSIMEEEYLKDWKKPDGTYDLDRSEIGKKFNKNAIPEMKKRMAQIILKAQMDGLSVKYAELEPADGMIVRDLANPANFLRTLEAPELLKKPQEVGYMDALRRITNQKVQLDLAAGDGAAKIKKIAECAQGMETLNFSTHCITIGVTGQKMRWQLLGKWAEKQGKSVGDALKGLSTARGFSTDRSCIPSHAIADLLAKGYSIKDIFNPDKLIEEKAEAGENAVQQYLDGKDRNDFQWMAKVNLKASRIILNAIDEGMKNVDFSDNASLFSKENEELFTMAYLLFDLTQEADKMKEECLRTLGADMGKDISDPDQRKDVQKESDQLHDQIQSLSALKYIMNGRKSAAQMSLGDMVSLSTNKTNIMAGEFARARFGKAVKAGTPVSKAMDPRTISEIYGGYDMVIRQEKKEDVRVFRDMAVTNTMQKVQDFGMLAANGGFQKNFRIGFEQAEDGKSFKATFEPLPKEPQVPVNPQGGHHVDAELNAKQNELGKKS